MQIEAATAQGLLLQLPRSKKQKTKKPIREVVLILKWLRKQKCAYAGLTWFVCVLVFCHQRLQVVEPVQVINTRFLVQVCLTTEHGSVAI